MICNGFFHKNNLNGSNFRENPGFGFFIVCGEHEKMKTYSLRHLFRIPFLFLNYFNVGFKNRQLVQLNTHLFYSIQMFLLSRSDCCDQLRNGGVQIEVWSSAVNPGRLFTNAYEPNIDTGFRLSN